MSISYRYMILNMQYIYIYIQICSHQLYPTVIQIWVFKTPCHTFNAPENHSRFGYLHSNLPLLNIRFGYIEVVQPVTHWPAIPPRLARARLQPKPCRMG